MYQIACGLKQMHDQRIMHRDLKPANIFVSSSGGLKIGDLGLGRLFSSGTMEVFTKVGTPLYMSPELLQGQGYDTRADV
jgi:NIMA (never in mitosis gene a)-related kinase